MPDDPPPQSPAAAPPPPPEPEPSSAPRNPGGGFGLHPAWLFPTRINRRHYLLRYILSRLPAAICFVILLRDPSLSEAAWAQLLDIFLLILIALLTTYTLLFVTFARLRDIGWPAWVILIPFLPVALMPQLALLLQAIFEFGLVLIPSLGRTFWGRAADPAS